MAAPAPPALPLAVPPSAWLCYFSNINGAEDRGERRGQAGRRAEESQGLCVPGRLLLHPHPPEDYDRIIENFFPPLTLLPTYLPSTITPLRTPLPPAPPRTSLRTMEMEKMLNDFSPTSRPLRRPSTLLPCGLSLLSPEPGVLSPVTSLTFTMNQLGVLGR